MSESKDPVNAEDKKALDAALAKFERDRQPGRAWQEVLHSIISPEGKRKLAGGLASIRTQPPV